MVSLAQVSLLSDKEVNDQYERLNKLLDGYINTASVSVDKKISIDPAKDSISISITHPLTSSETSGLPTNNIQARRNIPLHEQLTQLNLLNMMNAANGKTETAAPKKKISSDEDIEIVKEELDRVFSDICFKSAPQQKVTGLGLNIRVEDLTGTELAFKQNEKLRATTDRVTYPILTVTGPSGANEGEALGGTRCTSLLKPRNEHSASVVSLSGALSQRGPLSTRNKPKMLDPALMEQQYSYVKERAQSTRHMRSSEGGGVHNYFRKGIIDQASRQVHSPLKKPGTLGEHDGVTNLVEQNVAKFERELFLMKKGEMEAHEQENLDRDICIDYLDIVAQSRQATDRGKVDGLTTSPDLKKSFLMQDSDLPLAPIRGPVTYQIVVEEYEDGSRYEGEKYLEKRHGKGTLVYGDNFKYKGEWNNDLMEGYGSLWKNDKFIYEGEWRHGLFHGKGTMFNHEVDDSEEFDGTDFMKLRGGWDRFDGNFLNGMKQGVGTIIFKDGSTFCGNFRNDVVHGFGSFFKNGVTKVGSWLRNRLETWL